MKNMSPEQICEIVQTAAKQTGLTGEPLNKLLSMIHDILPEEEEKEEKEPRQKMQWGFLISDPEGHITSDHGGWIFQIPEEDSISFAEQRIMEAAHAFNASRNGRKVPVNTVGEACEAVPAKFFKEAKIAIKTKVPVLVMKTSNKLTEAPSV